MKGCDTTYKNIYIEIKKDGVEKFLDKLKEFGVASRLIEEDVDSLWKIIRIEHFIISDEILLQALGEAFLETAPFLPSFIQYKE